MVLGAGLGMAQSGFQYAMNVKLMKRQHQFTKMMSDTQYQRVMEDLRLAGLNPILAGRLGGATSAPGASASVSAPPIVQGAQLGADIEHKASAASLARQQMQTEKERTVKESNLAGIAQFDKEAKRLGISGHVLEDEINRGTITRNLRKAGKLAGPIVAPITSAIGAYFGGKSAGAIGRATKFTRGTSAAGAVFKRP